jgi:hypothetical protein
MLTNTTHATQRLGNNATPDLAEIENQAYRRLALEVVRQCVTDVKHSASPAERVDALDFLHEDGPEWLAMAGYGVQPSLWDALLTRLGGIHKQKCREERITKFAESLIRDLRTTLDQTTYAAQPMIGD